MDGIDQPKSPYISRKAGKEAASEKKATKRGDADEPSGEVVRANAASEAGPERITGRLPLVTGIRHWSTPDYTRIAIDLEQEVKYEAGRIASPDRIFFDLHDTKLAPELVGKSFQVEDGFLRRVRVAQYQRGMTRVVLEVDAVSDYSAFFLPNPSRLIAAIHGRQPTKTVLAKNDTASPAAGGKEKDKDK